MDPMGRLGHLGCGTVPTSLKMAWHFKPAWRCHRPSALYYRLCLHLRLLLLTKVLGRPEAEELVRSLEERLGQEAWVWRLLPSSCTTGSSLSLLLPLDSCLPWVRRLLLLSLSFLSRDSAELLDRRIVVHWRWL